MLAIQTFIVHNKDAALLLPSLSSAAHYSWRYTKFFLFCAQSPAELYTVEISIFAVEMSAIPVWRSEIVPCWNCAVVLWQTQHQSRTQSPRSSWSRNKGLWHNPFVFPTNPGDPVLLRICKVFQDGGHANRNRHYILILGRKYENFFVVLLSFLRDAIYSINK